MAIATVSLAGTSLAVACDGPAKQAPEPTPEPTPAATPASKPAADSDRPKVLIKSADSSSEDPSKYPKRWGQDPYDPEGEEEEGCPNGDWCGPADLASKFAPANDPVEIGCPTHIRGTVEHKLSAKDKRLKGLSMNPMMMGRLRKLASGEAREAGDKDTCCYHWFDYCSGRPLLADVGDTDTLGEQTPICAPTLSGQGWTPSISCLHTPEPTVGKAWLGDARHEHASIAAFAAQTLELLRAGAPSDLVAKSAQACRDETAHATACFGLAAHHLGEAAKPGSLNYRPSLVRSREQLACAIFIEGCIGETIASLVAARAAAASTCPHTQATLAAIADDEARHAELAWASVAWLLGQGGREVHDSLTSLLTRLAPQLEAPQVASRSDEDLTSYGRLGADARRQARTDAWRELIAPLARELLTCFGPSLPTDTRA